MARPHDDRRMADGHTTRRRYREVRHTGDGPSRKRIPDSPGQGRRRQDHIVKAALLACENAALKALADASLECLDRWRIRPMDTLFLLRRFRLHETIRAEYGLPTEGGEWSRMMDELQALTDMREAENRHAWHPFDVTANLALGALAVFSALDVADQIIARLGGDATWTVLLGLLALATLAIVWRLNRTRIHDWLHQTSMLEPSAYRLEAIPVPVPDGPGDTPATQAEETVSDTAK